ncbi:LRR receptor-like serine/threonine-protein kinase GHR1 [Pyrus x bretschneideri]|uniref:LRR receptor-like serine/threonine-protein kinase GHR1 n=1 Tax=Pyrus x bretschneideri TaxID=225117 RepID=UPI00203092CC|nr:LRR receptor-like serine/threonine-protein kinase GHR1 [Pyrus x bretschneideri]
MLAAQGVMQTICLSSMLLLLVLAVTSSGGGGQSDLGALLDLRKGIHKDPSGKLLVSWDSNSLDSDGCPLNWFGVTCSNGRVISIAINDVGLVGDFSFSAITGLTMLQNLSLSNNQLTGTISKVALFQSLEYLDLSSNLFHGLLPSDLVNLKGLVLLNLSSNQFEGILPSSFGKLEQLKFIDFRANGFSGDIMNFLSKMGSVVHLDVSSNLLSGSLDLGLGNSSFVSSIQYLNVSHNYLVGELFPHDGMPYFDSLEVFDASYNQLVGPIPSFNFVVSLRVLRLGNNQLSGSLPEALLQESSMLLSELDLSHNKLEGPVGSITSATLKKFNISSNKLSGSLPAMVGHCSVIDLSNNMLTGNLSRIRGWGNYIEVIELSSNSLTGSLPNETSQFFRLTSFKISKNSLEGILPTVLGTYPELNVIDLSLNHLQGLLLPSLFSSTKLTDLNLSGNNLSGSIPIQDISSDSSSGSAQNLSLVSIDLSNNSLAGHLPPEISKFCNLMYLDLSINNFEGSIPEDLPDVLKEFNVSFNHLSGVIPENLRQFPDSAFYPGNSLLIFPRSASSPKDVPNMTFREHRPLMKAAIRISLIAGLVGGAAVLVLLCLMIHYRSHWQRCRRGSSKASSGKKDAVQGGSALSHRHRSAPDKNVDCSKSSCDLLPKLSPSTQMGSAHDARDTLSVVKNPKNLGHPESQERGEGTSSPMSLLSSSNPSPSKKQQPPESPAVLTAYSPDKLAGYLHLFDGSLAFTAEELSCAPAEAIGRSCHGTMYKAMLDSGHVLAVKWLREGIAKGRKEFAREVKKLGNIRHPNLVSLLGYYWGPKEHEKLIISTYINAQSLAFHLHEAERTKLSPLSLEERLRISVDVARCLNFLHNEKAIPHGNLKSTNILLETPSLNALLTDYSLHRILTPAGTTEQVLNAGALGYRPPEFASSSKPCPSLKSDVYAFGVILLELLTGKSSGEIVSGIPGVVDLTDWVRLLAEENRCFECLDRLILERLSVKNSPTVLDGMLQVALRCIHPASERPDIKTVFEDISRIVN